MRNRTYSGGAPSALRNLINDPEAGSCVSSSARTCGGSHQSMGTPHLPARYCSDFPPLSPVVFPHHSSPDSLTLLRFVSYSIYTFLCTIQLTYLFTLSDIPLPLRVAFWSMLTSDVSSSPRHIVMSSKCGEEK